MPITLELWAASLLLTAVISGGMAWAYEYEQFAELKANVESADRQAADILREATAAAAETKLTQEIANAKLEVEHSEALESIRATNADLLSASRVWNSHQASCRNTSTKVSSSSEREKDNTEGTGTWLDSRQLSEGVDKLIQRADTRDVECHEVITFISSIPKELTQ
jgi:nitrogen fixation-related uncharacterized protein